MKRIVFLLVLSMAFSHTLFAGDGISYKKDRIAAMREAARELKHKDTRLSQALFEFANNDEAWLKNHQVEEARKLRRQMRDQRAGLDGPSLNSAAGTPAAAL